MAVLDMTEIGERGADPPGHAFEVFAREFLEQIGFATEGGPGEGPDAGRDFVAIERREGVAASTEVRWLVSCKHYAHSGKRVGAGDEEAILDRVRSAGCHGFLGVYSTGPSQALVDRLDQLTDIETLYYDAEHIERELLKSKANLECAERFFPKSVAAYRREYPLPAELFAENQSIECEYCGKDLLDPPEGVVVYWRQIPDEEEGRSSYTYLDIYWSCKGMCDRTLNRRYGAKYRDYSGAVDAWEDIADLCIPQVYLRWLMATMNGIRAGDWYEDQAFEKEKKFLVLVAPRVFRDPTSKEKDRVKDLVGLPEWAGGLGGG